MKITLHQIGKRFNNDWIFRNINFQFEQGESYVILGPNGSGKSTLLQLLSGNFLASEGKVEYASKQMEDGKWKMEVERNEIPIIIGDGENIYRYVSIAAPYLELVEEFTLEESIKFHRQFKSFINNFSVENIIDIIGLQKARHKELRYFSSGMKQRVKLALALLSDTPILLLDEPTSNLDKQGIEWYSNLVHSYSSNKLIIVCSNQQTYEYDFCKVQLNILDYK